MVTAILFDMDGVLVDNEKLKGSRRVWPFSACGGLREP